MSLQNYTDNYQPGMHTTVLLVFRVNMEFSKDAKEGVVKEIFSIALSPSLSLRVHAQGSELHKRRLCSSEINRVDI